MILYRVTDPDWAPPPLLLNGGGSQKGGGRWNEIETPAVYTAQSLEVCIAEKGYYSIRTKVDSFLKEKRVKKNPPEFFSEKLVDVPVVISKLIIHSDIKIADLSDPEKFARVLNQFGFSQYSFDGSRKSPYAARENSWTQTLGSALERAGFQGILVPSARSNFSSALVIYNKNLNIEDHITITEQFDATLSAVDIAGNKLKNFSTSNIDMDKVLMESKEHRLIVEILKL